MKIVLTSAYQNPQDEAQIVACTYLRDVRLWLLVSDYVKLWGPYLINHPDGIYTRYVVSPLSDTVKILVKDRFHGINFKNFIMPNELLIIDVRVLIKREGRRQIFKYFPRQLAKLLNVSNVRPVYEDIEISIGVGYYLQEGHMKSDCKSLKLSLHNYELDILKMCRDPPIMVLYRGDSICLAVPDSQIIIKKIYKSLRKEIPIAKVNALGSKCAIICVRP